MEVAPGVLVATSAVYATTTSVLVGSGGACLVVDPGVTRDEVATLGTALGARGLRPVAVWSTHPHWDHRLDGPGFVGVPRWGAPADGSDGRCADDERAPADDRAAREAERDADDELARVLRERPADAPAPVAPPPAPAPLRDAPDAPPGWRALDTAALGWPGPRVLVLAHRAHAPRHGSLLLPEVGVLVAGDMLSDVEAPLLDDDAADPLTDHAATLDAFAGAGARLVVPGHGSPGPAAERIAADRAYLVGLGDPGACDPRVTTPWQREADARARALARAARSSR